MRLSITTSCCRNNWIYAILLFLALSGPPDLSAQVIKTGNNIKVAVIGHPELSRIYKVADDGIIDIQNVGRIPIAGMTLDNLQYIISEQYKKIIPDAVVSIDITDEFEIMYEIYGAIKMPGRSKGTNFTTLQTAVVLAGGIDDVADLSRIRIMRENTSLTYNLDQFLTQGELTQNPRIKNNDVIYIPLNTQQTQIQVVGDVVKPGFYPFSQAMTLLDVITLAGGFTREANQKNIKLVRFYKKVPIEKEINLQKIIRQRKYQSIPTLEPGDIIIIDKRTERTKSFFTALGSFSQQVLLVVSLILTIQNIDK